MESFARDTAAQAKQRKAGQHDDRQATEMLNMLPQAFMWTKAGEQGNDTILASRPIRNFIRRLASRACLPPCRAR